MKKSVVFSFILFIGLVYVSAQTKRHTEKFEQLEYELRDPNEFRTASGAPGPKYWQNKADYIIEVALNDDNQSITGKETVTYFNNSPDPLSYLWLQLDQNVRAQGSDKQKTKTESIRPFIGPRDLLHILGNNFEGGFNIEYVKDSVGETMSYAINKTMMVIDLPKPLLTGDSVSFSIAWNYNIQNRIVLDGRSGYEFFPIDSNYQYTIAQFFPRMCVYSDYGGWQNKQFLGEGEFTLPFGDYEVSITVPSDHILGATGMLQNPEEVLTEVQRERLAKAKESDEPVLIVTQEEAEEAESKRATDTKTWIFKADSVRDFAFATSRKHIWDAMGVKIGDRIVMAHSLYPKEGNPLWEEYSTKVVAHTLEMYSDYAFEYPYHKAISVHAAQLGMEYPMICFNFGRPDPDGSYSEYVKNSMIMVIIHEVGHNFFPMIVNSDERQWTWMDEGLNTFLQYLTEQAWDPNYPSQEGPPELIVPYMRLDSSTLSPIMTNSEQVQKLGPNAYGKPATALNILRETIMGHELFDRAFKTYSQRWKFKHPTPSDFFRTMEDASGVDLDWFWRGWFYGVDPVDIALSNVTYYRMNTELPKSYEEEEKEDKKVKELSQEGKKKKKKQQKLEIEDQVVKKKEESEFQEFNYPFPIDKQISDLHFYELKFTNVGGLIMPVILEFLYENGTREKVYIPAEVWRKNDQEITKVFARPQPIKEIVLDPDKETADIDTDNNYWPKGGQPSRFDEFKQGPGQ